MKKILLIILTICATSTLFAQTFTDNGINYDVTSDTTVEVFNMSTFSGVAIIPSNVKNEGKTYSVTSISDYAFYNCSHLILSAVSLPNSIKTIGHSAFENCTSLTTFNIPNSVTTIAYNAFSGCTALTTLSLPNSITNIGQYSFKGCTALTSLNLPSSVINIGTGVFESCTALTSINIPNTVMSIGDYTFYNCKSLASINIPQSLTSIGKGAFANCSGISLVTIPNSVKSIGSTAFSRCTNLASLSISNSIDNIGDEAFADCSSLKSVSLPNSLNTIGDKVFQNCTGLISVIIPNSVTSIGNNAFYSCTALISVDIPNSVTSIGQEVFSSCTSLKTLNIPNSVNSLGNVAFFYCKGLKSITLNWINPLGINANVFDGVPFSSATLYVPVGTLAAYQAAPVWKDFGTILEQVTLPLTLTGLTAKPIAIGNQISWATANVVNVKNIILERSGADKNFTAIASLPATASQFIDTNPLAGDNYYRLSTIDNDGSPITYPQIAFVKGLTNNVSFYPNPVTNGLLNVVAGSAKIHTVAMFNLNGKKVVFVNTKNSPDKVAVSTQGLVKGVYVLEISSEKGKTIKKVLVN